MGETAQQPTATAAREALPKVASLATTEERLARMWSMTPPPADRGRPARRVHARRDAPMGEQVSERGAAGRWRVLLHHGPQRRRRAAEQDEMPPHTITGEQFWGGALHPLPRTATPTGRQR